MTENNSWMKRLGELSGLGMEMVAAIVIPLFLGNFIDKKLETSPLFVVVAIFLGLGANVKILLNYFKIKNVKKDE